MFSPCELDRGWAHQGIRPSVACEKVPVGGSEKREAHLSGDVRELGGLTPAAYFDDSVARPRGDLQSGVTGPFETWWFERITAPGELGTAPAIRSRGSHLPLA